MRFAVARGQMFVIDESMTDYTLGKCVGIGHFATVHAAVRRQTGERCAVKISREAVYGTAGCLASGAAGLSRARGSRSAAAQFREVCAHSAAHRKFVQT